MPISNNELKILEALLEKKDAPMGDDELAAIEGRLNSIYEEAPDAFDAMCHWNRHVKRLDVIASDNGKLLAEIKRLRKLLADKGNP